MTLCACASQADGPASSGATPERRTAPAAAEVKDAPAAKPTAVRAPRKSTASAPASTIEKKKPRSRPKTEGKSEKTDGS